MLKTDLDYVESVWSSFNDVFGCVSKMAEFSSKQNEPRYQHDPVLFELRYGNVKSALRDACKKLASESRTGRWNCLFNQDDRAPEAQDFRGVIKRTASSLPRTMVCPVKVFRVLITIKLCRYNFDGSCITEPDAVKSFDILLPYLRKYIDTVVHLLRYKAKNCPDEHIADSLKNIAREFPDLMSIATPVGRRADRVAKSPQNVSDEERKDLDNAWTFVLARMDDRGLLLPPDGSDAGSRSRLILSWSQLKGIVTGAAKTLRSKGSEIGSTEKTSEAVQGEANGSSGIAPSGALPVDLEKKPGWAMVVTNGAAKQQSKATKGKNINARMLEMLHKNEVEVVGWSAVKWGLKLDCHHSTVKGTPTWCGLLKTLRIAAKLNKNATKRKGVGR